MPTYHEGPPTAIDAGTYVTAQDGFLPGLQLTIPAGWTMTEADSGEIGLHPADRPDHSVFIWKDMRAVVTNDRRHHVGQVLPDVDGTADQLVNWVATNNDFDLLSKPTPATVASSVRGRQLTLNVSQTARFGSRDCPDNPRCAAIFTNPAHWGSNFFAIGGKETARVFIGTAHFAEGDHTLLVVLDVSSPDEVARFAAEAQPIVDSLRLPQKYTN